MTTTDPKTVKARKRHQCYWCGEPIEVGETYTRWVCFDGGRALSTEVHTECKEAWDKGIEGGGWYYREEVGFGDHFRGCLCQRPHCECGKRAT